MVPSSSPPPLELGGRYLLGPSIATFSTFGAALVTSFQMMNANFIFNDLIAAIPAGDISRAFAVPFYYYSFILVHYFILLNLLIAMIVESYMMVVGERKEIVTQTLANNLGPLQYDLLQWARVIVTDVGGMLSLPFAGAVVHDGESPWSEDIWSEVQISHQPPTTPAPMTFSAPSPPLAHPEPNPSPASLASLGVTPYTNTLEYPNRSPASLGDTLHVRYTPPVTC